MGFHIDPVCGKKMNANKAHIVIMFEGQEVYLCCPICQREFERNPKKYLKRKRTH